MGKTAECFRCCSGVMRSGHPQYSFCALGARAKEITACHSLDFGLGEESPLAKIYEPGGHVLLIGVDHSSNTSLHLAEYRAKYARKKVQQDWAPVLEEKKRVEKNIFDINLDNEDFSKIGRDYEKSGYPLSKGKIGQAESRLMPQRNLVDFAVKWMEVNRKNAE